MRSQPPAKFRLQLEKNSPFVQEFFFYKDNLQHSIKALPPFYKNIIKARAQEPQEPPPQTQEPWRGVASGLPAQYLKTNSR